MKAQKKVEQAVQVVQNQEGDYIQLALQQGVSVDVIERLVDLRIKTKAVLAKEAYITAMSAFQGECPIIEKTKKVMNKDNRTVRYQYAPIESIVSQVKDLLKKHGFSYSIDMKVNGSIEVFCKVTHREGHSEVSTYSVPIDKSAFMNEQQKVASASTFAKRYAFCNAFGILTGDEDDDSNSIEPKKAAANQTTTNEKPLPKVDDTKKAKEVERVVQDILNKVSSAITKDEIDVQRLRVNNNKSKFTEEQYDKMVDAMNIQECDLEEAQMCEYDSKTNLPNEE